jgi:hypothetical protein
MNRALRLTYLFQLAPKNIQQSNGPKNLKQWSLQDSNKKKDLMHVVCPSMMNAIAFSGAGEGR